MLMAKLGPVAPGVPGLRSGTQHAACLIHYDSVDWRPARWKHVLGVEVCYPFGRVFIIFSSGLIFLLVWRRDLIEEEILIDFQLSLGWICEWDKAIDGSAWLSIKSFTKKSGTVNWFLHLFGFVCYTWLLPCYITVLFTYISIFSVLLSSGSVVLQQINNTEYCGRNADTKLLIHLEECALEKAILQKLYLGCCISFAGILDFIKTGINYQGSTENAGFFIQLLFAKYQGEWWMCAISSACCITWGKCRMHSETLLNFSYNFWLQSRILDCLSTECFAFI